MICTLKFYRALLILSFFFTFCLGADKVNVIETRRGAARVEHRNGRIRSKLSIAQPRRVNLCEALSVSFECDLGAPLAAIRSISASGQRAAQLGREPANMRATAATEDGVVANSPDAH